MTYFTRIIDFLSRVTSNQNTSPFWQRVEASKVATASQADVVTLAQPTTGAPKLEEDLRQAA